MLDYTFLSYNTETFPKINMLEIDTYLFHVIHNDIANPVFDLILPIIRNKAFWIPLYVFIIAFLFFNFSPKKALLYIVFLLVTVGTADFMSSTVIKKSVKRVRPCNQIEMQSEIRNLVHCGGGYSFTSSHAANHFALVAFLIFTFGRFMKKIRIPLLIWAAIIGFAQIYVGVHFPLDILFGAMVGIILGSIMAEVYNRWIRINIYSHKNKEDIVTL